MNELTKQMQQIMHPRAVLVAYECETTDYSTPRSYLELRPVNEKGRMGAGIPVTYEFMNSLVESYTESMSGIPHGRIPGNMLLCDPRKGRERYIWYNPPQKRKMYFQDGLHITDGTFNVPGIIYVVERECMDIHAFKGAIPEERTELYLAPFFNVFLWRTAIRARRMDAATHCAATTTSSVIFSCCRHCCFSAALSSFPCSQALV